MVIVSDLGKVILDFSHRCISSRLASRSGIHEEEIHRFLFEGDLVDRYDSGRIGSRDFHYGVCTFLGVSIPFEEFKDIWCRIFVANDETCKLIKALKRHYRLILLSNTNEMHFEYAYGAFDILKEFDELVLSYQVGEIKPNSKIFEAVLSKAGCAAGDCIYFDDVEPYVQAGRAMGMNAIVFRSAPRLREDLKLHNIEVEVT